MSTLICKSCGQRIKMDFSSKFGMLSIINLVGHMSTCKPKTANALDNDDATKDAIKQVILTFFDIETEDANCSAKKNGKGNTTKKTKNT